jgi:PAP2 superfamily
MAIASGDAVVPGDHPPFSTDPASAFHAEAIEVYDAVNQRTAEQEAIARFWSDDPGAIVTPPGHSCSIAAHVLRQEDASLMLAAETFAKVGIAVNDAFIACWHAKYRYNLLRPVSYLRANVDAGWLPLLTTPPFPEYPSGHSVQSGAAFHVLADLFGDDHRFVDHTHDDRGLPARRFTSFTAAADEAGISRLYGGIHFRAAIELGLTQGRSIGAAVTALPFGR